jgi:tetratricopeptide (TPR) repeat protein
MSQSILQVRPQIRFEEVTPASDHAAFFTGSLESVIGHLDLPIFTGYDDLGDLLFVFLTLPTGNTVTLGQYLNSSSPETSLYVDPKMSNVAQGVFDSCQYLQIPRSQVLWFHPNIQPEINLLYQSQQSVFPTLSDSKHHSRKVFKDPIDCFEHAIKIYNRESSPDYWVMLQYNLGSTYYRKQNFEKAQQCFDAIQEYIAAISPSKSISINHQIDEQQISHLRNQLAELISEKMPVAQ